MQTNDELIEILYTWCQMMWSTRKVGHSGILLLNHQPEAWTTTHQGLLHYCLNIFGTPRGTTVGIGGHIPLVGHQAVDRSGRLVIVVGEPIEDVLGDGVHRRLL